MNFEYNNVKDCLKTVIPVNFILLLISAFILLNDKLF